MNNKFNVIVNQSLFIIVINYIVYFHLFIGFNVFTKRGKITYIYILYYISSVFCLKPEIILFTIEKVSFKLFHS